MRKLFSLDPRLAKCAEFVRKGCCVADVGTDHGLLPVWLARMGWVTTALACDINPSPLISAQKTIRIHSAEGVVTTRLSDGLDAVGPWEADDIVIAGMGGELIAEILCRTSWIKDPSKHLILQPMTTSEALRIFLASHGFDTLREEAVIAGKRPYTVILAAYSGALISCKGIEPYVGKLAPDTRASRLYLEKQMRNLRNKQKSPDTDDLSSVIGELEQYIS